MPATRNIGRAPPPLTGRGRYSSGGKSIGGKSGAGLGKSGAGLGKSGAGLGKSGAGLGKGVGPGRMRRQRKIHRDSVHGISEFCFLFFVKLRNKLIIFPSI